MFRRAVYPANILLTVLICIGMSVISANAQKTENTFEAVIEDMTKIGEGAVTLYKKQNQYLALIPNDHFERTLLWYVEVSKYPPNAINVVGNSVASNIVQLERFENKIFVRSLSGDTPKQTGNQGYFGDHTKSRPIDIAVANAQLGPILLSLDIIAEDADRSVLVDITSVFTVDIPGIPVSNQIPLSGAAPIGVDPSKSYISKINVFPQNLHLRAHLTFLANRFGATVPISIEISHSFALLPKTPMTPREFDPRIGYFTTEVNEFEPENGQATAVRRFITRYRLEKQNPDEPISEVVKPIVFYIAPEVPIRWRPYLKQAVEAWQPAFEAAGFKNAIIARDAPSIEEDPNWSPDDIRFNVIRWLAQPFGNAMGPQVHDPRSGEIISAHILVWPQVLELFSDYYYSIMAATDPDITGLPLSEAKMGEILRYAVTHEVGHSIGLRHNHKASTAYGLAKLRDPEFTSSHGPTASIMAYGRFNYIAQPDDGVTNLIPRVSVYDNFAINWGYADRSANELDELAARQITEPELRWGAGELPEETVGSFDPTVQKENIGADRIEATKLGIKNIERIVNGLLSATANLNDDNKKIKAIYDMALERQQGMLDSVALLIGGIVETRSPANRVANQFEYIKATKASEAVRYLLVDGVSSYEPFLNPEILQKFRPFGGVTGLETRVAKIVNGILDTDKILLLNMQAQLDPDNAYELDQFIADVEDAIWSNTSEQLPPSILQRAVQRSYLQNLQALLSAADAPSEELYAVFVAAGIDTSIAEFFTSGLQASGIKEIIRTKLPSLEDRLNAAINATNLPSVQRHYQALLRQVNLLKSL